MEHESLSLILALFPVGLGLVLLGGANLVLARRPLPYRLAVSVAACGGGIALAGWWLPDAPARWAAAGVLAGVALASAGLGSAKALGLLSGALWLLRHPQARWAAVGALGLGALAAAPLV